MSRPGVAWPLTYMQAEFAKQPDDQTLLRMLDEELALRRTPSARQLHLQVRDALRSLSLPVVRSKAAEVAERARQSERNIMLRIQEVRERRTAGQQPLPVGRPLQSKLLDGSEELQPASPVNAADGSERLAAQISTQLAPLPIVSRALPPTSDASPDTARRTLGVTAGASWQAIESARRLIVGRAHPALLQQASPAERTRLQSDADGANSAFAVLLELQQTRA